MNSLSVSSIVKMVDLMADIIIENEVYFCELDSAAGDGDFGMSISKGFKILKKEWDNISKDEVGGFLKACGMIITEHCGGASGPIWGSAFRSAGRSASGKVELSLKEFAEMLQASVSGIMKTGGAKLGDKTLLDALIPAADSLRRSAESEDEIINAMNNSALAAVEGAEGTKLIAASKGRASYLGERSINHPDAGAAAIGVIFTGIIDRL